MAPDGILVFEAESAQLSTGCEFQDEVAGYSGEGYIIWSLETMTEAKGQGLVQYELGPGMHTLYLSGWS